MDVAILLFEGFDELDAIGPYEVFDNARVAGADCTVTLRTVAPVERVTASHGLRVEPDGTLAAVDPDLVVVPGGGWNTRGEAGAWAEAEDGAIPDALADLHAEGVTLASVCTGGMLLERAGVLDDRPAVTHGGAMDDLRDSAAEAIDARVVDDGDVLTCGGVVSGLDLAVYLVEREFGAAIADAVRTEMEHEGSSDVYVSE